MVGTDSVAYYKDTDYKYSTLYNGKLSGMHVVKRTIFFCIAIAILPAVLIILPLYLKYSVFADVIYPVAESDIMEIRDGISSIFCERHTLRMNSSFNAFQLNHMPKHSQKRKHIRLKKSMTLPDDTLEYWGFYLMKGATVALRVCSRYEGSRILVVKGDRHLNTCGLTDHNLNKFGPTFNSEHAQVRVTFEGEAEVVYDANDTRNKSHKKNKQHLNGRVDENHNHAGEDVSDLDQPQVAKLNYKKSSKQQTQENSIETNDTLSKKTEISETDTKQQHESQVNSSNQNQENVNGTTINHNKKHRTRHHNKGNRNKTENPKNQTGISNEQIEATVERKKRDTILDRGIHHGGNAYNYTENLSESISSFENSLLECYDGLILLAQTFKPAPNCDSVKFLENGRHMVTTHEVVSDGYYYYIFYSDNDQVKNDIHAVFDIYKPTFLYSNISESKGCINSTECTFPIQFFSDEIVILEVPTRDGIEHEEDDITYLISTCTPRMAIYVIFPISVLFLILSCAFI